MTRRRLAGAVRLLGLLLATIAGASPASAGDGLAPAQSLLLSKIGCGVLNEPADIALPVTAIDDGVLDILAIGSSSTAGVGAGRSAGGSDLAYPAQLAKRLLVRLTTRGADVDIRVTARGVSGERAAGALKRLGQEIANRKLDQAKPDILIWQVGVNDAIAGVPLPALRAQILAGLKIAQAAELPIVLVDPQYFPKIRQNQHYADTVRAIAQIARSRDVALVRRFARMRRAEAIGPQAMAALLAPDRFHMSGAGHACLALDLAATLSRMIELAPK